MKIPRKVSVRQVKRITGLISVSVIYVLLVMLVEPLYSLAAKAFYFWLCLVMLSRLWNEGLSDWDVLAVA